MGPTETRDLMFASAGILWGAVTVYRGMQTWKRSLPKSSSSLFILFGIALAASCLSYLVHRI